MNDLHRESRCHSLGIVGVCGILLLGGCAPHLGQVSYREFEQTFPKVREQAKRVQKQYPELFTYLAERDGVMQKMSQVYRDAIPHPDDLPVIEHPFIGAVVTVFEPQDDCSGCGVNCNGAFYNSSPSQRRICEKQNIVTCNICENGLFLIRGGLAALVGSSVSGGPQPEPP